MIHLLYAAALALYLLSGKATILVHPRYLPLMAASAVVLLILSLVTLRTQNRKNPDGVLLFVIPLFFIPGVLKPFPSRMGQQQPVAIEKRETPSPSSISADRFLREKGTSAQIPEEGIIVIDDVLFFAYYNQLYDHREEYLGREISMTGYLYNGESIPDGRLLLGRMIMWCCADDAFTIGFLISNPEEILRDAAPGQWIEATAVIEETSYSDNQSGEQYQVLALRIESFSITRAPSDPFVYPDF